MSKPVVDSEVREVRPTELDTVDLPAQRRPLQVRTFGLTDVGRVRDCNEDQFLIARLSKALQVEHTSLPQPTVQYGQEHAYLFVVADGVGGSAGGEKASAVAVNSLEGFLLSTLKWFHHFKGREGDQVLREFQQALGQADTKVFDEAARQPELRGMATTLTMAYSLGDELFVAHVGDSRCYLHRQGTLYQMTRDHTLAEDLVQRGGLLAEEAAKSPYRHVITNVVGGTEHGVRIDVHKMHLEAGDLVLLCSDGLTEMLPAEEIAAVLQAESSPADACQRLVAAANDRGGKDNVTVLLARFEAPAA